MSLALIYQRLIIKSGRFRSTQRVKRKQYVPSNRLEFDKNVFGESGHFIGRTCWPMITKEVGVDAIDSRKIIQRLEEDLCRHKRQLI